MRGRVLAWFGVVAIAGAGAAQDFRVNPGNFGPNALPPQPGEPARVPDALLLHVDVAAQRTDAGDVSGLPSFRIEAPFGRWVSMISEGRPVEFWRASARTRDELGLVEAAGATGGDLSFGAKFLVFDGGSRAPSFALRTLTKTTTGKGFHARRFINAPGYLFDAIASHALASPFGGRLEAWANVGFFAWQQGLDGQNDCVNWSLTVAQAFEGGSLVRLDARGYDGWQSADSPVVLGGAAEWRASDRVRLTAGAAWGVRDPAFVEARVGVTFHLPALLPFSSDE